MSDFDFSLQFSSNRVIFGSGTRRLVGQQAERLGMSNALVVSTAEQQDMAADVAEHLGTVRAALCPRAVMHTPKDITDLAMADLARASANGIISVGGGSAIGLGKAVALRTGLPHLAVPTTYAGSEMTPILGETKNGIKTTQRAPSILPAATVYDVELTLGLPTTLSVTSGMNAMAHAVEALYAQDGNPIISLMAQEAISNLMGALPLIHRYPQSIDGRCLALQGAWLAGSCLGSVSMSIHHKLCHVLGGSFDLPHAETHTVMLPYVTGFVSDAVPQAMKRIQRAANLGDRSPAKAIQDLARGCGAPTNLAQIGMNADQLDRAAELATLNPYWSPKPFDRETIRHLLQNAFEGTTP
ncbi:maleylacetate reductase [Rhizobium sp. FY34]|uniref:maleylacetate reductase n=1 Tax=Rhizobium sp. FY34 TaxID=2562309 RepID=UPI0010C086B9|nr:maleylacetate reductase [Rhizobium sp. FY34]